MFASGCKDSLNYSARTPDPAQAVKQAENCSSWALETAGIWYEEAARRTKNPQDQIKYLAIAVERYSFLAEVHKRWSWFPGESEIAERLYQKVDGLSQKIEEIKVRSSN